MVNVVAVTTAVPSLSVRRFLVTWTSCLTWAFGVPASLVGSVDAELFRLEEVDGSLSSFSFFDSDSELELEEFLEDKVRLESRSTLTLDFSSAIGLIFLSTFSFCSEDSESPDLDSSSDSEPESELEEDSAEMLLARGVETLGFNSTEGALMAGSSESESELESESD